MKYAQLIILLSGALSPAALAAIPTALPSFKSEKQLTTWRAEQVAKSNKFPTSESLAFYTGKPYVHSSNGYAFKYRTYTPVESRWTSEDPSGFPDGANPNCYSNSPTNVIDPDGLDTVSVTYSPGDGATSSSGALTFTTRTGGKAANGDILGVMDGNFSVSSNFNGWVVQQVTYSSNIKNDSDNSTYTIPGLPSSFFEAWKVTNGVVQASGQDTFSTSTLPGTTHGSLTITGKAGLYTNAQVGSTSPNTWTGGGMTSVLYNTTGAVSWWTGGGVTHTLKMNWE